MPYTAAAPRGQDDRSLVERTTLYQTALADLKRLQETEKVTATTFVVIDTFYRQQLDVIRETIHEQQSIETVHRLVADARRAAHDQRFLEAVERLQQAAKYDQGIYPLNLVIAEVTARKNARDREEANARRAIDLLWQARQEIAAQRLNEAREKLEQAKQLNPDNSQVSTALQEIEAKLLAEHSEMPEAPDEAAGIDDQLIVATLLSEPGENGARDEQPAAVAEPNLLLPAAPFEESKQAVEPARPRVITASFADECEPDRPSPTQRLIEAASQWSAVIKPFLLDNVGWFVGAFLVVAGFVVLIVTFWGSIEQNPILMNSLVYVSLLVATATFFSAAYFMRLRYPQLESSSNVLLVIVALLIPLVFAAAILTSLVPAAPADVAFVLNLE